MKGGKETVYCKHCGTKNREDALYCVKDGEALTLQNEHVLLHHENTRYCSSCSHENQANAHYCAACGQTTSRVKEVRDGETIRAARQNNGMTSSTNGLISSLTNKNNLKWLAIWNGASIAGLFLISFIISASINGVLKDIMRGELGSLVDGMKLMSFTDVFMISHMTGVDYHASAAIFEGVLSTTSGLFLLLLIPAVVFITTGFLMNRKQAHKPIIEKLKWNLSFSVVYGLFTGIFSLFAGVSMEINDPTGFIGSITIGSEYPFIESMFNAAIISFIFTSIGTIFTLDRELRSSNERYGLSISKAILHSMIGLAVMMAAGYFILSSHDELTTEETTGDVLVGSQVGGYLWNISQFQKLSFELTADGESVNASYSLIGGPEASEDEEEFAELFEEINWIWILVLIPAALHVWAGNLLRKTTQGNILNELAVYAVTFGIVNAIIVSISKLSIDTNFEGAFSATFGFSALGTLVISSILAFGVSYLGVMVTNRQETRQSSRAA
jgi:hypothetical protein